MGFLDNLIRREVRRAVSSAADAVTDNVMNAVLGKVGQTGANTSSGTDTSAKANTPSGGNTSSRPNITVDGVPIFGGKNSNSTTGNDEAIRENKEATGMENCSGEELLRQRIERIAAAEKPEFELRGQVSSSEVDAPQGAEPYFSYGFYKDGKLVAVIQILHTNNAYGYKRVRLAQRACRAQGVKYMNFMSYMTNRPEYVSNCFTRMLR
ncbi:MAG: hypothetical protein NC079_11455 [Clostridium sp.]|nr:hypothetical protein [Acetatifactor muris]MCM1528044.1 hypothetical protein [Bacteroides sp.]MCM1564206.1 hypothetical protein [Clostridium sp.]